MAETKTAVGRTAAEVAKLKTQWQTAREERHTTLCAEIEERIAELKELEFQYRLTAIENEQPKKRIGRPPGATNKVQTMPA